jgi:hypothetical protein
MKRETRQRLAIAFFGLVLFACASVSVSSLAQSREGDVVEGDHFEGVVIGKSTMNEVRAAYGEDYELVKHRDYSFEMLYKNLGLSFYSCQRDPQNEIFTVEIKAPFRATTSKGVVLGESTLADVFRIYGKASETSAGFEYEGVSFFFLKTGEAEEPAEETAAVTDAADAEAEKPDSTVDPASGAENVFVIDIEELTNFRAGSLKSGNDLPFEPVEEVTAETANSETEETEETEAAEIVVEKDESDQIDEKAAKARIVNRIELIEKSGLRQCETKFPKNQNR